MVQSEKRGFDIIIYKTSTCPYCHMAEDFLKENKIKFKSIDVGEDPKAAEEMIKKTGQMSVPVIEINKKIIIGFDKIAIKKILGLV
ncbi:MAG: glutaredoxin family protein [Nanoarchaeota archaeon]